MTANHWSNWSGSVSAEPAARPSPADVEELQALVCSGKGPIRVAGAGHSFTPLVGSAGTIVSLDWISGLKGHDPDKCQASVGGGTRLRDLTKALQDVGQA